MTIRMLFSVAVVSALLISTGCGSGPKLVPVSGIVTLNGEPLEGAELTFVPDPGNAEMTPGGDQTGPNGNYKAMYNFRSGLAPGKYTVLISKKTGTGEGAENAPPEIMGDPTMAAMGGYMEETLPEKYADPLKSDFNIEVPEEGGVFEFDVKGDSES
ncbi:carboxypeptidase-like regulatory domain-containing protein [Tautonia rosea]|uniref:carboxypeptidase-like regulatory domain-containing protein n=1 Tax=Tautonia rosea TaxID=2728037 RepID=UPI0014761F53|nr:carboxypeptidase-like regulatory domain-containing protein [Tautonia rosea]